MHKFGLCIALIPLACSSHDPCDRPFVEMGQCITENFEGTRRAGTGFEGATGGACGLGAINGSLGINAINGSLGISEINGSLGIDSINGSLGIASVGCTGGGDVSGGGEGVNNDAACQDLCGSFLSCMVKAGLEDSFNRENVYSDCVDGCSHTLSDHPDCFSDVQSAADACSSMTDCFAFGECVSNQKKESDCG